MAGKKERGRWFYSATLILGSAWLGLCVIAPIWPNGRLISFVFGMAPPIALAGPLFFLTAILLLRFFKKPAWGLLQVGTLILALGGFSLLGYRFNFFKEMSSSGDVKVMTINVHFSSITLPKLLERIRKDDIDLVMMQEVKKKERGPAHWLKNNLDGWHIAEAREVAIISKYPLGKITRIPSKALEFRSILLVEVLAPTPYLAATVHWSSPQYEEGLEKMKIGAERQSLDFRQTMELIQSIGESKPFILGGDFNNPPRHKHTKELSRVLTNAFDEAGTGFGWTYHKKLPVVRIDYLYTNKQFDVETCYVDKEIGSDHLPVVAELSFKEQ
jgi:endonuclease/exonuclease/phosphatase (EEP) superfamily protein YafD